MRLTTFFATNFIVIYFGSALIYVLMGFGAAVAAYTFRDSRFALVRSLPFLAAFGLLEGAAQWGAVFIPLQASYLDATALSYLAVVQTGIVAVASTALFAFGTRLVADTVPGSWLPRLQVLPFLAFALWCVGFLTTNPGAPLTTAFAGWRLDGIRLATYLLALPGAALGAWGILSQRQDLARYYPRAAWFLTGTVASLVLFVPLALGNIPVVPVLPVEVPQLVHFRRILGVPVQVFLALDGLVLAISTMQALEVFRRENQYRWEEAERHQAALEERDRIGRELHDVVLQDALGVGMLLESARLTLDQGEGQAAGETLALVQRQLGRTAEQLRAFIVGLEPMAWDTADLTKGFRQLVEEFRAHTLVPVRLDVESDLPLDPAWLPHLFLVLQESLTNVRRHAGASRVLVQFGRAEHDLLLRIRDNGHGLPDGVVAGPGLLRMQRAAAAVDGQLHVVNVSGGGTEVSLRIPRAAASVYPIS